MGRRDKYGLTNIKWYEIYKNQTVPFSLICAYLSHEFSKICLNHMMQQEAKMDGTEHIGYCQQILWRHALKASYVNQSSPFYLCLCPLLLGSHYAQVIGTSKDIAQTPYQSQGVSEPWDHTIESKKEILIKIM